jgi:tRNA-2-methylthio-N6-dimethylallyladenosine synthase
MNEYDSELVTTILTNAGFSVVQTLDEAEIVLLNTCAVRENAHRKVFGHIHAIRHARKGRPVTIGILGCMAENLKEDLLADKHLDIAFLAGPDSYRRLPAVINEVLGQKSKPHDITLDNLETYDGIYPTRQSGVNAWLAVMRGCNNFCSFCVVPYTRGRERSRTLTSIIDEVRDLVAAGCKQVTLLGQNVNSYKDGQTDFADLLKAVAAVDGLYRVRFTSPHPKDFSEKLLTTIADNPKICKQMHFPLQSGSTRILKKMNRSYTKEGFLDHIRTIRSICPAMALSTDIIVGFPTETDKEFADTVDVMERVRFDSAFIFKYSPRKDTLAAKKYPDDVPEATKTGRIVRLNSLQKQISLEKNQAYVGKTVSILIEEANAKVTRGRTDSNKIVTLEAPGAKPGDLIDVAITYASPHALKGEPVPV